MFDSKLGRSVDAAAKTGVLGELSFSVSFEGRTEPAAVPAPAIAAASVGSGYRNGLGVYSAPAAGPDSTWLSSESVLPLPANKSRGPVRRFSVLGSPLTPYERMIGSDESLLGLARRLRQQKSSNARRTMNATPPTVPACHSGRRNEGVDPPPTMAPVLDEDPPFPCCGSLPALSPPDDEPPTPVTLDSGEELEEVVEP